MNKVTLHDSFVPTGINAAFVNAVTAGAGAVWIDLYQAVTTKGGRCVQGGGCTSVAVAGLIQSGGFGSFSVTKVTLRTHALPEFSGGAEGRIKAASDSAYRKLLSQFVRFYRESLFNPHWGEQAVLEPGNILKLSMVFQGLTGPQSREIWEPFFASVKSSPQDFTIMENLRAGALEARKWWQFNEGDSLIHDPRAGAPKHHGWWKGDQD